MMDNGMVSRIDWRRDAVKWGRLLAVCVALLGTVAVAIDASNLRQYQYLGDFARTRHFIMSMPAVAFYGALVLIVTELLARLRNDEPLPVWNAADLVRAIGVAIIVVGLLVSTWTAIELSHGQPERPASQVQSPCATYWVSWSVPTSGRGAS